MILHTDPAARSGAIEALDELRLGEQRRGRGPIRVAIPTEREVAEYWPSGF